MSTSSNRQGSGIGETDKDSLADLSSLPSGVFEACEPNVEAELAGSVAQIFLRHMATEEPPPSVPKAIIAKPVRDVVSKEEVETFTSIRALQATVQPPDLKKNLSAERLWILADLATHGTSASRQRANKELGGCINDLWETQELEQSLLTQLIQLIDQARERTGVSMNVLLMAASNAAEDQDEASSPEPRAKVG
jgi:hypothetical protein